MHPNNLTDDHIHFNSLDRILYIVIVSFFFTGFIWWVFVNIFGINDTFIWFLAIPIVVYISHFISDKLFVDTIEMHFSALKPYVLLAVFLTISALFYFEPLLHGSVSTIGIPNKDLHDGIAVYISDHGKAPVDVVNQDTLYIPNSHDGLFLGYPNVLHTIAGFLNKMGVSVFYTTWVGFTFGLLLSSISIFLLSKLITRNLYYSATIGGLFALSSLRLSLGAVASIPMLFSFTLILPVFYSCILTIHNHKSHIAFIGPAIGLALLAGSYTGTIVVLVGLLLVYLVLIGFRKSQYWIYCIRLFLYGLPFMIIVFLYQKSIYWQNTFPTSVDYDPYELSQRFLLLDAPVYMVVYLISLTYMFFYLLTHKYRNSHSKKLYLFFLMINLGLLFLPLYDVIFHYIHNITSSDQLVGVNPDGFFGGLNHQKVSRLALLQPFFFVFILPYIALIGKKYIYHVVIAIGIIALAFVIRIDLPLYPWIAPEIRESLYNQADVHKPYTLLSHMRLIRNDQIWTPDIVDGLDYMNQESGKYASIMVWDSRGWSEETIAGWGSDYIRRKLFTHKELFGTIDRIDDATINSLKARGVAYMILINDPALIHVNTSLLTKLWNQGSVTVYHISP